MNGLLEYKSIGCEIKDLDTEKRIVTGYLSAFGNKDHHGDVIEKGAFAQTLNSRKSQIFFLNQHNWGQPHGKFNVLREDQKGLYFESNKLIDTTYSNDLLKLYDAGIVKEHSIGYSTVVSEYDSKTETRYLKELKLYEGSNVTLGANPDTPFTGMKSLTIEEINDRANKILKAIKDGTFTDETFMLLEVGLKQLQLEAFELGKKSLAEPFEDTLLDEPKISKQNINDFIKNL